MNKYKYIVTVHMGTGSMAEGMQPIAAFDFVDEAEADGFATFIYNHCANRNETCRDEMLTCVTKIVDLTPYMVDPVAVEFEGEVKENQKVIDLNALVEEVFADYIEDDEDD